MRRLLLLLLLLATGCGRSAGPPQPPTLALGHDVCARCGMAVEDVRFAAALQPADGDALVFDDPGDMFAWRTEHSDRAVLAAWVMDFERGEWLALEQATFLRDIRLQTPMGHNVLAVATRERALAVQRRHGGTPCSADDASRRVLDQLSMLSTKGASQ